jgi:4-methylaminobutanoate oxidase (formaldehyde-forming)
MSYARYYRIAWPNHEADAGARAPGIRSTRHSRAPARVRQQVRLGAAELVRAAGTPAVETPSFERGPAFDAIGAEHRAVRERVALIDMSSFSSTRSRPRRARCCRRSRSTTSTGRPGPIVYTQLCNERGGIEADVTITRLAGTASISSPAARWACATARRSSASAHRRQRRDRRAHVGEGGAELCGPRSRDVLAALTDAPLDNASFRT